jgi:hypothetical protein
MLASVLFSIGAWFIPDIPGLRRGFVESADLTVTSAAILLCWYLGLAIICIIGYGIGHLVVPKLRMHGSIRFNNPLPYWVLTGLAAVGNLMALLVMFTQIGINEFIDLLMRGEGNRVRESLYSDYSIGIVSLRYVACASFALALFRVIQMGSRGWIEFFNLILLVVTSFVAGRLAILCTAIMFGFIYFSYDSRDSRRAPRIKIGQWLAMGGAAVLLLNVMSYSRNANFYEELGQGGFWESGFSEAVAYLGSPVQVSVSVANFMANFGYPADYRDYTDIEQNLTTNSAFADIFSVSGYSGLVDFALRVFFWSLTLGYLARYSETYFAVPAGSIMYAFAEIWRIDMFSQGFFLTILLSTVAVPLALSVTFNFFARDRRDFN